MLKHCMAIVAAILAAGPAFADTGPLEAGVRWQLDFGHGGARAGYGVALAYREGALGVRHALAAIDVSDTGALARFAGVPLPARDFRLAQTELATSAAAVEPAPWYARRWVWWTTGAIGLTAALAGGGGGSDTSLCANCDADDEDDSLNVVGGTVNGPGDTQVCVLQGGPVGPDVCAEALVGVDRAGAFLARDAGAAWLDQGTGRMGDLLPR